jgi:hypothetical protein
LAIIPTVAMYFLSGVSEMFVGFQSNGNRLRKRYSRA